MNSKQSSSDEGVRLLKLMCYGGFRPADQEKISLLSYDSPSPTGKDEKWRM